MKVKYAIFDFDGTLFDSMFVWDTAAESYLRSLGKAPKPSMREDVRALSLYQSACYFRDEYDISLSVHEITNGVNQIIEHFYINDVQPKTGVAFDKSEKRQVELQQMCGCYIADFAHTESFWEFASAQ